MSTAGSQTRPRQLLILSGKGGTGKTSVAAGLAFLAPSVVLADCDVDAANLHLLLEPERQKTETFVSGKQAVIRPDRCNSCGDCFERCRFGGVVRRPEQADGNGRPAFEVDPLACEGCGLCALVCTAGAIDMIEPVRGEYYVSSTRTAPLVHARLAAGGQNSGRLVTLVRDQAMALAENRGRELVLIDGPPGIGCPAIASVTGVDLVLLVCEPTVSSEHDLMRAIELVEGFGVSLAVCINKREIDADLSQSIRGMCGERGIPVAGELSYDLAVVDAQLQGKSVVETGDGPVALQIREMWDVISDLLEGTKG